MLPEAVAPFRFVKELEMVQEILAGAKATFVFGSGEIADHLRGLTASGAPGEDF